MGLPLSFYLSLDSRTREPLVRWLRGTADHGIGFGSDLLDALPLGYAYFPADVDAMLRACEAETLIEKVGFAPSFSRRAFLTLEGRGAAKGSSYQYPVDCSWRIRPGIDLVALLDGV